jgi:hypothetical protein
MTRGRQVANGREREAPKTTEDKMIDLPAWIPPPIILSIALGCIGLMIQVFSHSMVVGKSTSGGRPKIVNSSTNPEEQEPLTGVTSKTI